MHLIGFLILVLASTSWSATPSSAPTQQLVEIAEQHLTKSCDEFKNTQKNDPQRVAQMRPQLKEKITHRCARFSAAQKSRFKSKVLVSLLREEWQDNAKRLLVVAYVDQKVNFETARRYDMNFDRIAKALKSSYEEQESPGLSQPYVLGVLDKCARYAVPEGTHSVLDLSDTSAFSKMSEAHKEKIKAFFATTKSNCRDTNTSYLFLVANVIGSHDEIDVWGIDEKKNITHIRDGNK